MFTLLKILQHFKFKRPMSNNEWHIKIKFPVYSYNRWNIETAIFNQFIKLRRRTPSWYRNRHNNISNLDVFVEKFHYKAKVKSWSTINYRSENKSNTLQNTIPRIWIWVRCNISNIFDAVIFYLFFFFFGLIRWFLTYFSFKCILRILLMGFYSWC